MKTLKINQTESPVLSYISIRRAIGILGIALPIVLWLGTFLFSDCTGVQGSISDYYHTIMRNILVGILCAVSLFLFTYHGFDNRDRNAGKIASILALGVAFFPTDLKGLVTGCTIDPVFYKDWFSTVHLVSAVLFFLMLSYFSLFLFTKSEHTEENTKNQFTIIFGHDIFKKKYTDKLDPRKKLRNRIYIICGLTIFISLLLMAIYIWFFKGKYSSLDQCQPIYWLEATALWAFGISWLTKGQVLYGDKNIK